MNKLGGKIRLLRLQKDWSQKDVAKRLDISIPVFSKIETGITDINLSRLNQIAKLFDWTTVQLLSSDTGEIKDHINEVKVILYPPPTNSSGQLIKSLSLLLPNKPVT